jgi:hypothetical protein
MHRVAAGQIVRVYIASRNAALQIGQGKRTVFLVIALHVILHRDTRAM